MSKSAPKRIRYHLQVRRGEDWGPPSVGGIEGGFEDIIEAASLKDTLLEYDAEYYAGVSWRIVEEVRQVVWEEIR